MPTPEIPNPITGDEPIQQVNKSVSKTLSSQTHSLANDKKLNGTTAPDVASNGKHIDHSSDKVSSQRQPKQIDGIFPFYYMILTSNLLFFVVNVIPCGKSVHFTILVHLPNDDRLMIKLYEGVTLQDLISAIESNCDMSLKDCTLIRNASGFSGEKSDLLSMPEAKNSLLKDTLGFCKREKLFLDLKP